VIAIGNAQKDFFEMPSMRKSLGSKFEFARPTKKWFYEGVSGIHLE
jgi:hypothetical protein